MDYSTFLCDMRKIKFPISKLVKNWCLKNNVEYIDLNAFLARDGQLIHELTTDGCHLQPCAYKPWGDAVKKAIAKYGI